ncbi:MAG: hypothetical protein HYU66_23570 [Armatimonadetes bacterium]|nr:hypothetical protein [Armatimonadota bacterium]
MSRNSLDKDEREATLREIESELDAEIGTTTTTTTYTPTKQKPGWTFWKVVGAIAAVWVGWRLLGLLLHLALRLVVPLAMVALLVGGAFWLIGLLKKGKRLA